MTQFDNLEFDSGEFEPEEPEQELTPAESNNLMAMLVDRHLSPNPVPAIDMFEVDRRMDIATCYRIVLKSPLFGEPSEASKIVEDEVRAFVRGRLEVLVGMKPDNKPVEVFKSPFTEQEVVTLKSLAKLKDKEIKVLNDILVKVLGSTPTVNTATPAKKPAPVLVPRTNVSPVAVQSPSPVIAAPVVAPGPTTPKRRPGRPPAAVKVENPDTGEVREGELREPKMKTVKNPNALPMPSGTGMYLATQMAALKSAEAIQKKQITAVQGGDDTHVRL